VIQIEMPTAARMVYAAALAAACLWIPHARAQDVLHRAHAHNAYEHARPLLDALDRGFLSVEVDVHLIGDSLYVAHDREEVRPGRTLESLYLEPLGRRVRRNGGVVYPDSPPLQLLVDVKSEAESTYRALRRMLESYSDMLTRFADGSRLEGAVTVIVSGNRARETMRKQGVRFAAYDGRLDDLEDHRDASPAFIPLISINWVDISSWRGDGEIPASARERLRDIVARTHGQSRTLRFWGTRDTTAVWRVLAEEGVDFIGADDLDALQRFLLRLDRN